MNSDTSRSDANIKRPRENTLLMQLRCKKARSQLNIEDPKDLKERIIQHQSEFPVKIREAVRRNQHENPEKFNFRVKDAVHTLLICKPCPGVLREGLDHEIDTKEEVEVLFRVFPDPLTLRRPVPSRIQLTDLLSSPKTLPFVPFLAEFALDLCQPCEKMDAKDVIYSLLAFKAQEHDIEFQKKLDETSLSALMRLKEKGFMKKAINYSYFICKTALGSYRERSLAFLIDWNPTVLKGPEDYHPLLWNCLYRSRVSFEVFRIIFERCMVHYPEDMGFLFAVNCRLRFDDIPCLFKAACNWFGKQKVVEMVCEERLNESRIYCS